MGAIADVLAQKLSFSLQDPVGRQLTKLSTGRADAAVPTTLTAKSTVITLAEDTVDHTGGTFTLTVTFKSGETFTTGTIVFDRIIRGDSIHTISTDGTDHTGGDFTLTVLLLNGETFTTAAIAFDASAATTETAIDVAATAAPITGWTNGDITVSASGADLQDGTLTLTFDGTSVAGPNHVLTTMVDSRTGGVSPTPTLVNSTIGIEYQMDVAATLASITGWVNGDIVVSGGTDFQAGDIVLTFSGTSVTAIQQGTVSVDDALMTGGTSPADRVTITTSGQGARPARAVLENLGVIAIDATPPTEDEDASSTSVTAGPGLQSVSPNLIKGLMKEAAAEDGNNDAYFSIEAALYSGDRAPLMEQGTVVLP